MHDFCVCILLSLLSILCSRLGCFNSLEFSLNRAELSLNSVNSGNLENLRNHWSMNWVQYKDLLCYLCLCGLVVVSSLSLTWEILGSSPTLPILYFINFFCHWIQQIQWKHLEKLHCAVKIATDLSGVHSMQQRRMTQENSINFSFFISANLVNQILALLQLSCLPFWDTLFSLSWELCPLQGYKCLPWVLVNTSYTESRLQQVRWQGEEHSDIMSRFLLT